MAPCHIVQFFFFFFASTNFISTIFFTDPALLVPRKMSEHLETKSLDFEEFGELDKLGINKLDIKDDEMNGWISKR